MPRAARAAERLPSQRPIIEIRTAEAQRADAERRLGDKQREEQDSLRRRRGAEREAEASAAEVAKLTKANSDKSQHKISNAETLRLRTIDILQDPRTTLCTRLSHMFLIITAT